MQRLFLFKHRDVHFLSAMTLEPFRTAYCLGRHGPLISLGWDSLSPQVLHASSAQGDLLSFDTSPPHARRGHPHQQQQMSGGAAVEGNCALLKKLASRTGGKNRECMTIQFVVSQRCEIVSAICEDDLMTVSMD